MLARLLRGAELSTPIEWPSVNAETGAYSSNAPLLTSNEQSGADMPSDIHTELLSLRSENIRLKALLQDAEQNAFQKGRQAGEDSVRNVLESKIEADVVKLRILMKEVKAAVPKLRRQTEEDLIRLAIAVARRVLHRELTIDSTALSGLIRAAFDKVDSRQILHIRTDPASLKVVEQVVSAMDTASGMRVVPDPALRSGSLILEFPKGELDASVETQLNEIERGFIDVVRHS